MELAGGPRWLRRLASSLRITREPAGQPIEIEDLAEVIALDILDREDEADAARRASEEQDF